MRLSPANSPMKPILLCDKCCNEFVPDSGIQKFQVVHKDQLRSNQLPCHTESAQTLVHLQREELELERYDREILRLREAMEELERQRNGLSTRIQSRRSWISPIRRLPVEILEEVFKVACSNSSLNICRLSPKTEFAPILILGQVSHHWRQTINANARLWSSIKIDLSTKARIGPLLEHYLVKSKDCSLDIQLTWSSTKPRTNTSTYRIPLCDISPLFHHFDRIEKLSFNTKQDQDLLSYLTFHKQVSFPSLRSFSHSGEHHISPSSRFWDAIFVAPKLTSVTIDRLDVKVPYHRLTTLVLPGPCNYMSLSIVLRRCINLQSLNIHNLTVMAPVQQEALMTTMPSLRHMSITTRGQDITTFLQNLTSPRLVSLEITVWTSDVTAGTPLFPLTDLLRRSGCRLSDLILEIPYIRYSDAELRDLLALCSGLSRLEVNTWEGKEDSQTFIYRLLDTLRAPADNSQGTLIPNLTALKVTEEGSSVDPDTAFALLDMLESRRTSHKNAALVDLEFGEMWGCPAEVMSAFDEGLKRLKNAECNIKWARSSLVEGRNVDGLLSLDALDGSGNLGYVDLTRDT